MNKKTPAKILNKQKKRERERLTVDLFFLLALTSEEVVFFHFQDPDATSSHW